MKELTFDNIEMYCLDVNQKILRGECSEHDGGSSDYAKIKDMVDCFLKTGLIIEGDVRKRLFSEAIMKSIKEHGVIVPIVVATHYKNDTEQALYFILE